MMINGHRVASPLEMARIPVEAILRVDILPEAVALQYGFQPGQKVVNIVLRPRYAAETGEADGGASTEGGGEQGKLDADVVRLRGEQVVNVDVTYQAGAKITEAQRGVIQPPPAAPFSLAGNVTSIIPRRDRPGAQRPRRPADHHRWRAARRSARRADPRRLRCGRRFADNYRHPPGHDPGGRQLADWGERRLHQAARPRRDHGFGGPAVDVERAIARAAGRHADHPRWRPVLALRRARAARRLQRRAWPVDLEGGWNGRLGLGFAGGVGRWTINVTGLLTYVANTTATDAGIDPAPLQGRSMRPRPPSIRSRLGRPRWCDPYHATRAARVRPAWP